MRKAALVVVMSLATTLAALGLVPSSAPAQPAVPRMSLVLYGETVNNAFVFTPSRILIPQVPIVLNVTFVNNESVASGTVHTFTINDDAGNIVIDTGLLQPQESASLEFTIAAIDEIVFGNVTFTPEPTAGGRGILFFCVPHRGVGMIGDIVLATTPEPAAELGVFLRAYWIGIIAIVAMIVWIGISYFVVKSSSRRFTDHKEHVRKGLP